MVLKRRVVLALTLALGCETESPRPSPGAPPPAASATTSAAPTPEPAWSAQPLGKPIEDIGLSDLTSSLEGGGFEVRSARAGAEAGALPVEKGEDGKDKERTEPNAPVGLRSLLVIAERAPVADAGFSGQRVTVRRLCGALSGWRRDLEREGAAIHEHAGCIFAVSVADDSKASAALLASLIDQSSGGAD